MIDKEPIITVLGPTATGKTGVAVRIAAELGGEIVSADSRQVFRRMDIGSGKDLSEYQYDGQPIPYHLIDIEEPGVEYNVFRYQQAAYEAMEEIRSRSHRIVFCGGSGMYEYREHAPHLLSGGQKQRIAIAGVLAMQPDCIVLDEPTAMLDPVGREEVVETISRLNRERGMTVVLITHHMSEAIGADRVIVMHEGGILLDGTPREVFTQVRTLRDAGLDVPQTTELLFELRSRGWDLPLDALSEEACAEAVLRALQA